MSKGKVTKEMLEKAKSAEELLALAKENGVELTSEQAAKLFEKLNGAVELTDDEIGEIAGGLLWSVKDPGPQEEEETGKGTPKPNFI